MPKKVGVVIQARTGSKRLPGKMLFPINGLSLIERIMRIVKNINADEHVVACPESDVKLFKFFAEKEGFKIIGGSEDNVVERIAKAVKELELDVLVHITGDKAFLSPKYTELAIDHYLTHNCDVVSYEDSPLKEMTGAVYYPSILYSALMSIKTTKHQLEHVKPCFTENPECTHCKLPTPDNLKKIKDFPFTIDTENDYLSVVKWDLEFRKWPIEPEDILKFYE